MSWRKDSLSNDRQISDDRFSASATTGILARPKTRGAQHAVLSFSSIRPSSSRTGLKGNQRSEGTYIFQLSDRRMKGWKSDRKARCSRLTLEQVARKRPCHQLRQLKGKWVFCTDGSCTRAVCSAWIGRRFGKGGFCTICVRASCAGWRGWTAG